MTDRRLWFIATLLALAGIALNIVLWITRQRNIPVVFVRRLHRDATSKALHEALQKQIKAGEDVEPLPNWTLHDLRRTAKTLMVRAGVRRDISERVGHVIAGVEGTATMGQCPR